MLHSCKWKTALVVATTVLLACFGTYVQADVTISEKLSELSSENCECEGSRQGRNLNEEATTGSEEGTTEGKTGEAASTESETSEGESSEAGTESEAGKEGEAGEEGEEEGEHEDEYWWDADYQYEYFECCVIVVLVFITMIFDEIHHKTEVMATNTEKDSSLSAVPGNGQARHHSCTVWESFHHRVSGELCVLGFLSFASWAATQAGLFEKVAESLSGHDIKLPPNAEGYIESVEAAHINIFLAMCFYFIVVAFVVVIASHFTKFVVVANYAICEAYQKGEIGDDPAQYLANKSRSFVMFFSLRRHYFSTLQTRRPEWSYLDKKISLFEDRLTPKEHQEDGLNMNKLMCKWFPFDIYLVVNYRYILDDMIEIKASTWIMICFVRALQAVFLRTQKKSLEYSFLAWLVFCQSLILLAVIWVAVESFRLFRAPKHSSYLHPKPKCRCMPLRFACRVLQMCLVFCTYELARTIASKQAWQGTSGHTNKLYICIGFAAALIPEGLIIGVALPLMSGLVAIDYFMQESHVNRMTAIVMAHVEGRDSHLRKLGDDTEEFEELVTEETKSAKDIASDLPQNPATERSQLTTHLSPAPPKSIDDCTPNKSKMTVML